MKAKPKSKPQAMGNKAKAAISARRAGGDAKAAGKAPAPPAKPSTVRKLKRPAAAAQAPQAPMKLRPSPARPPRPPRGRPALPPQERQTAMIHERVTQAQREAYEALGGKAALIAWLASKPRTRGGEG